MKFTTLLLSITLLMAGTGVSAESALEASIVNFHQHSETLATGGTIDLDTAPAQLANAGYATVVDLRTSQEGTTEEEIAVLDQNLNYVNIPLGSELPNEEEIGRFTQLMEDNSNFPMLLHCRSGNRVGTLWASYQITEGVPVEQALSEGAAMGMSAGNAERLREKYAKNAQ